MSKEIEDRISKLEKRVWYLEVLLNINKTEELNKTNKEKTFNKVLTTVYTFYKVSRNTIFTKNRKDVAVKIRRMFFYILCENYNISETIISNLLLDEVGFVLDRTTIMYHVDSVRSTIRIGDNTKGTIDDYKDLCSLLLINKND